MPREAFPLPENGLSSPYFSQAVAAGDFIFVSGQGPWDPVTGQVRGQTIEEQTELTLTNIASILAACGSSMADVVKANVHLNDIRNFERFSQVYRRHFSDPKPARTTVGSTLENIMVEIDVIAYRKR